jgi:hypothetical protein
MDQEQRIAELERRLAGMEAKRAAGGPLGRRGLRPGPRRLTLAVALVIAVVAGPAVVLAAHDFTDVPTTQTFHGQIGAVKDAGITAGCSPTGYCPDAPVTRGQMAAFLRRGLGRVAEATFGDTLDSSGLVHVGQVEIKAGDVTGGTARVLVQASVSAYAGSGPCGCRVVWYLEDAYGSGSLNWATDLDNPTGLPWDSSALSDVFTVPTGVTTTFYVSAIRTETADVEVYGHITAMVIPFDGTGEAGGLSGASVGSPDDPTMPMTP